MVHVPPDWLPFGPCCSRIVIDIKSSHDPQPSVLRRPLIERASSAGPQAKRQKAEDHSEPSNIATRLSKNTYSSFDEVLRDIDSAVSSIITEIDLPDDAVKRRHIPVAPEKTALCNKILGFQTKAHDLVRKHKASNEKSPNAFMERNTTMQEDGLVLSMYGNTAGGPKQLFSSRQQQRSAQGEDQDNTQPVREIALPSGMFTTDIGPAVSMSTTDWKSARTLGDLFPTPPSLPTLEPPRPSKVATTREAMVGWYQPAKTVLPPRVEDYYNQPIATGQWLDYSNASPSHGSKRRQRSRTMSVVGSKVPQLDAENTDSEAAKLDALFRGAYSGFAPSKDNAAALVTVDFMNRIWWEKNGEKSFERLIENGSNMDVVSTTEPGRNGSPSVDADEDEKLREAVEELGEESIDPTLDPKVEKSALEKDADEVLEGISELLETLNSYQRIRNLSLNSAKGTLSASETTSHGTPSQPSEAEVATYEVLKTQLALMIATLPPFAVAKLDSDQLAELSISSKIPIPVEDYSGVMEEEEIITRARLAGAGAASAIARVAQPVSLQRHGSSALYGNQYSAPRPAGPVPQQYYGSQTPVRPSSGNLQRPPATAPSHYPMQRPAQAAPYRQAGYGTPTYPHQARSVSQQYNPSPQYLQTSGLPTYSRTPSQPYQAVSQPASQAQMNTRYPSQSSYSQQSPIQNGLGYPYGNGVNVNRQPSPQKGIYSPQPVTAQVHGPASYSTPTHSTPQGNRPYLQNHISRSPITNGASPSPQPQPQGAPQPLGLTTPYSTFMTTAEQASMMERQRAQLAQQQGLQQQARNAAQAGTMGSPPKTQINGSALAAGL